MSDQGHRGDAVADKRPEGLWGGRFDSPVHPAIHAFTNSLRFDRRLVRHDLIGSLAHVRMLLETNILSEEHAAPLLLGLSDLLREVEAGVLSVEGPDEDIHAWIERTLGERIGPDAGRVHTARSRNDQTSVALRLWTRESIGRLVAAALELVKVWGGQAREHRETFLPGYTHLQRAQPVSLAHHLLAHAWSVLSDARRLHLLHRQCGVSPLGAAALAGTSFAVDARRTADLLGFPAVHPNSLHAVADRDWAVETAFGCALLQVHLSRWAEEVVLWTSAEFGFAALSDEVGQGSSIMPQKKNPEAAELVRGKAARSIGHVVSLLTLLKGLPLAYNSDLQEDKEPLFDAVSTALSTLEAAAAVSRGLQFRRARMRAALRGGFLTATELADGLVRAGVPFREAHARVGKAVREADARGCELADLPPEVLEDCCPELGASASELLDPERAVRARRAGSGPAPESVDEQLVALGEATSFLRGWLEALDPPPIYRAHRDGTLLQRGLSVSDRGREDP